MYYSGKQSRLYDVYHHQYLSLFLLLILLTFAVAAGSSSTEEAAEAMTVVVVYPMAGILFVRKSANKHRSFTNYDYNQSSNIDILQE